MPAGCGAWRVLGDGRAEIKRVYVEPAFRRRGLAQVLVDALEATRRGRRVPVAWSSTPAPSSPRRWRSTPRSATHRCPASASTPARPVAVFLGKDLTAPARGEEAHAWAS